MSHEGTQDVLFQDPIGVRLRLGREKAGLGIEQAAQQLKLPVAIVEAMESDNWQRLGAPVYVRSYLGSYLRLVGLPATLAEQVAQDKPAPPLVSLGGGSRVRHALNHSMRNLVYLVMTAVLVLPVVLVVRHYQAERPAELLTLEPPADLAPSPLLAADPAQAPLDTAPATASPEPAPPSVDAEGPAPVMASMTPFQKPLAKDDGLLLRFTGESWVDVVDGNGQRVERGLVAAGSERRFAAGQVAHITLGNADAVEVSFDGATIDLAPFRAANVARFAVSSSGEPAPARH